MPLWTGEELARAIGGARRGVLPAEIGGISIDSRTLQKGDAFFAIAGERADGHNFLPQAEAAGAALAVIEAGRAGEAAALSLPLLLVENVQTALEDLGRAARARLRPQARVAAITGSVGKTTVKEMLALALAAFGRVHYSPASFNNHWGVPLSLARMPRETDFAVFEIGMNHAGEIEPLTKMARPHLALITQIAAAHMGHFGSLREIAAAKAEIFIGLAPLSAARLGAETDSPMSEELVPSETRRKQENSNGAAILPRDDAQYQFLEVKARAAGARRILSFGRSAEADYRIKSEQSLPEGQEFMFVPKGAASVAVRLAARGGHMAQNACAVLAATAAFGQDTGKAAAALTQFRPQAGRGAQYRLALPPQADERSETGRNNEADERGIYPPRDKAQAETADERSETRRESDKEGGQWVLIDESYNANPASMRAALKLLGAADVRPPRRRIAVLGDMLELGETAQAEHEQLAAEIIAAKADIAVLIGENMRFLADKLRQSAPNIAVHWQENAAGLAAKLAALIRDGDVLMVKGSNSVGLGGAVKKLLADCGEIG